MSPFKIPILFSGCFCIMPGGLRVSLEGACDSVLATAENKLGERMNSEMQGQFFASPPLDEVMWVASGFLGI